MSVKLLTEHLLEVLSLKGGCTGSSESTLVKMSNRWTFHATAQFYYCLSERGEQTICNELIKKKNFNHIKPKVPFGDLRKQCLPLLETAELGV